MKRSLLIPIAMSTSLLVYGVCDNMIKGLVPDFKLCNNTPCTRFTYSPAIQVCRVSSNSGYNCIPGETYPYNAQEYRNGDCFLAMASCSGGSPFGEPTEHTGTEKLSQPCPPES